MNVMAIIDRLDDKLNPIVVKELRQAVKSRMVVGILGLFLGLQLLLLGFFLLSGESRAQSQVIDWSAGYEIFRIQQGVLLFTIMIAVPAYACVRLANERTDQNVDLMFISTLRPASIVWGKFFAAMVLGLLVFSACAPFMTFAYLLRGIDMPSILTVLAVDFLAMSFGVMVALFVASIPGGRAVKVFFAFAAFIFLFANFIWLSALTVSFVELGTFEWMFRNWYVVAVIVLGVVGFLGLLFFYCVAMISPPSANRILPLRVYLFFTWAALAVSLFATSMYVRGGSVSAVPIIFFVFLVTPFLCVQLWISICERDRWGPRIARTIPTVGVARPLAFLFYTGSGGGIIYSVALILATLVGSLAWLKGYVAVAAPAATPGVELDVAEAMIRVMAYVSLYAFCFGLSAILVRHYLLANQVKSAHTWLIAVLLVGLGSSIPSFIAYIAFHDQVRYQHDPGWWSLTSPIYAMYELCHDLPKSRYADFEALLAWFLGIWAVLVAVLCLPGVIAQMRRFQPSRRAEEAAQAVVLDRVGAGEPRMAPTGPQPGAYPVTAIQPAAAEGQP